MKTIVGKVIFLNGTSSSGKTTIARALQNKIDKPFFYISLDDYLNKLPETYLADNQFMVSALPQLLDGFHHSAAAIARAGNNLIIDHVLQEPDWVMPCVQAFDNVEVIFVGVRCRLDVLENRERNRGDRQLGMARYQFEKVHSCGSYDIEIDTSDSSVMECVNIIIDFLNGNRLPTSFTRLRVVEK